MLITVGEAKAVARKTALRHVPNSELHGFGMGPPRSAKSCVQRFPDALDSQRGPTKVQGVRLELPLNGHPIRSIVKAASLAQKMRILFVVIITIMMITFVGRLSVAFLPFFIDASFHLLRSWLARFSFIASTRRRNSSSVDSCFFHISPAPFSPFFWVS